MFWISKRFDISDVSFLIHLWNNTDKGHNMTIKVVAAEVKQEEGDKKKVELEEEKSQYW